MNIFKFIGKFYAFISRIARVIVKFDDFKVEAKAFWDSLFEEDEPKE